MAYFTRKPWAAVLAAGASAGSITLRTVPHGVSAEITGLVLTGASEVVAVTPAGWGPTHRAGHGFVEDTAGGWWPVRATVTGIEILGPAPAGTTVEGNLTWTL